MRVIYNLYKYLWKIFIVVFNKIFIDGDESLPRWSGYRLGYYLVKKYLQDKSKDIYTATLDRYKEFI